MAAEMCHSPASVRSTLAEMLAPYTMLAPY